MSLPKVITRIRSHQYNWITDELKFEVDYMDKDSSEWVSASVIEEKNQQNSENFQRYYSQQTKKTEVDYKTFLEEIKIKNKPKMVLSIDGGALRGVLTLELLKVIEQKTGKKIHEIFDLIVGTSSGALLSYALGKKKFSIEHIGSIIQELAEKVFTKEPKSNNPISIISNKVAQAWETLTNMVGGTVKHRSLSGLSVYDVKELERILQEICEDQKLNDFQDDDDDDETTPKVSFVCTRVDIDPNIPFLFRTYDIDSKQNDLEAINNHGKLFQNGEYIDGAPLLFPGTSNALAWEALRASSAATPYFNSIKILVDDERMEFVDGGYAQQDPSLIAFIEAQKLFPENQNILIVSLGSGLEKHRKNPRSDYSLAGYGGDVLEQLWDSQRMLSQLLARNLFPSTVKYFRFNPTIDDELIEFGTAKYMKKWIEIAQEYMQNEKSLQAMDKLANYIIKFKGPSSSSA